MSRLFIYNHRYRDTLLRLMTPGHTKLYIIAMYYDDPDFTGLKYYIILYAFTILNYFRSSEMSF